MKLIIITRKRVIVFSISASYPFVLKMQILFLKLSWQEPLGACGQTSLSEDPTGHPASVRGIDVATKRSQTLRKRHISRKF